MNFLKLYDPNDISVLLYKVRWYNFSISSNLTTKMAPFGLLTFTFLKASYHPIPRFKMVFMNWERRGGNWKEISPCSPHLILKIRTYLQVNLCQKLLFLHQLTHNMTTDCSLNYKFNTWKFQAQNWGEHVVYRNCFWHSEQYFCTQHVLPMFCKKKSFWQRFTTN